LKKRDVLVQNQFDRQDVRLARHRRDIDDHEKAIHNWVCVPQAFGDLAWLKECIYRATAIRSCPQRLPMWKKRSATVRTIAIGCPGCPTPSRPWLRHRAVRFLRINHPALFPFLRQLLLSTLQSSPYLHRRQVTLIRRIAARGPSSPLSR
jgi:hypothetical protein